VTSNLKQLQRNTKAQDIQRMLHVVHQEL